MGRDNTARYQRFQSAYFKAFKTNKKNENVKKEMEEEWKRRQKKNDREAEFETRIRQLLAIKNKSTIFHAFNNNNNQKKKSAVEGMLLTLTLGEDELQSNS